jgi:hypothetical protein
VEDKFIQHEVDMDVQSVLSPIIRNMYMEYLEKFAFDSVQHKPSLWMWYVDDIFVAWPNGPEWLQNFLSHLNSSRAFHPVHYGNRANSVIPFLYVLIIKKG